MKVMIVKEVMKGDVSPVAMFFFHCYTKLHHIAVWAHNHIMYMKDKNGIAQVLKLSLSSCAPTQFSCTDGLCIDLLNRSQQITYLNAPNYLFIYTSLFY